MNLREAAQQALEALDSALGAVDGHYYDAVVPSANIAADALRTALAESERDWSLLEATQESLREHMAEVQRLRAALAQPAASGGPDMRHPKIQALIGGKARREIELRLVEQLLDDPDCDLSAMDMEYWHGLHDKLREKLTAAPAQPAPARVPPSVSPEAHADFVRALHGGKGELDAWLECYDETEVRAHVLALIQPAASGEPVAHVSECEACFTPDACQLRGTCDHYAAEKLRIAAAPHPAPARVPAEPVAYRYRIRRPGGIEGETWHLIGSPGQRDATSASLGAPAEPLYTAQPAPAPECDSPKLCAVNGACAGQYGTKKQCATAQPAPARVPLTDSALLDAFCVTPGIHQFIQAFKAGARFAERAHGITPAKEAP